MATLTKSCAFIALSMLLAACSSDEGPATPTGGEEAKPEAIPTTSDIQLSGEEAAICQAINEMGFDFYEAVSNDSRIMSQYPNMAFSPVSLSLGIGLMSNIIDPTDAEMLTEKLGFESVSDLNALCHKLMMFLPDASNKSKIEIANSVWHNTDLKPSDNCVTTIGDFYFHKPVAIDFSQPTAVSTINQWVSDATHGLINSLIDRIEPSDRIVFANALYFNSDWLNQFRENATEKAVFTSAGKDYQIDMMSNLLNAAYYSDTDYLAVTLPYEGTNEFIALLPSKSSTLSDVMKSFSCATLDKIVKSSTKEDIALKLPKFKSSAKLDCNSVFDAMGLRLSDSKLTGFNKIYGSETYPLTINHEAVVSVSERGTEAAAVTGGLITAGDENDQAIEVTFNRPFAYIIRNTKTGSIIMMGQYTQPQ